ncbi:MAG: excinuclease ABC subunit UvrB, partial [Pseudomonadota bacterium]
MAQRPKKTGKPTALGKSHVEQSEAQDLRRFESGFEEAPQKALDGAPIQGGSIDDWVKQLEADAAREQRDAEMSEIRSKAGKHRRKAAGTPESITRTAKSSAAERERAGGDG